MLDDKCADTQTDSMFKKEELFFAFCSQIDLFIESRKKLLIQQGHHPSTLLNFKIKLKTYALKDCLKNVFNVLYAPIYIILSDTSFWLREAGWDTPSKLLKKIPPNWPNSFQKEIESYVLGDIFELNKKDIDGGLRPYLLKNPILTKYKNEMPEKFHDVSEELECMVKSRFNDYSTKKARRTDITISCFSMVLGLMALDNSDWSFQELANNLATFWAKEEAASDFIFGENLGHAFYSFITVDPDQIQLSFSFLVVFLAFTFTIQLLCLISHLIQIRSGQLPRRTEEFIDDTRTRLWSRVLELLDEPCGILAPNRTPTFTKDTNGTSNSRDSTKSSPSTESGVTFRPSHSTISWILGVCSLLFGVAGLFTTMPIGIYFIFLGLVLVPPSRGFVKNAVAPLFNGKGPTTAMTVGSLVGAFILVSIIVGATQGERMESEQTKKAEAESIEQQKWDRISKPDP